jgi:hypothetical protein
MVDSDNVLQIKSAQKGKRNWSENRQRQKRIIFRVSQEEYEAIEADAERVGLTLASHVRDSVLKAPKTRARRRVGVDVLAVTKLQGEMNKIGGNLHQILKRVNFGDTPLVVELNEALTGYKETIAAILVALGRNKK